jgi:hypothetical protein
MKQFILAHAWSRVSPQQRNGLLSLDVIYNLARGDTKHPPENPCGIDFDPGFTPPQVGLSISLGRRDTKTIVACSAIKSSESTATLTTSVR